MTALIWNDYINTSWLYMGLLLAYVVTVLSIVGIVIAENRNPLKTLAWVTVLLLFPVGGIILYIFFGRSIKNTNMISRRKRRKLLRNEVPVLPRRERAALSPENRQHVQLARSLTGALFTEENRIEVQTEGSEMIRTLMQDIEQAERYIHLQYYIIEDDTTGRALGELLLRKVRQGVKVRVIYDDIGSIHLSRKFLKQMRAEGVEIYPFSRVAFPPFATRINWRNHRKVTVIDGRVGYIGGMNIADRYISGGKKFPLWRDTHLRVQGPALASLQYSFAVDWNSMGRPLLTEAAGHKEVKGRPNASVQMVTSGPTSRWTNISLMLLKAIGNAKKRIYIQTPYFLPTESLLRALQAAALARVDVRVMIPLRSDSATLTHASRSYVQECLRAGIKFYFFEAGMLHSKVIIVDDDFSTVGSTNFDFRSFEHNFEGNLFIYSTEVNRQLANNFIRDQHMCQRIYLSRWRHRAITERVYESLTRLLAPIL